MIEKSIIVMIQSVFKKENIMSKLVIYHGSKDIIEKPYYHGGKAENDYGFGFYCTESLDLA